MLCLLHVVSHCVGAKKESAAMPKHAGMKMGGKVKAMMMKEKSLDAKKKRTAESYHEKPDKPQQRTVDQAAAKFNAVQVKRGETVNVNMFRSFNKALVPPFHIWLDTNFINFSMQNKMDVVEGMMDCLLAKVIPCICDCVMAELEKLGKKFRIALRLARDPRFKRLHCDHKYADDCVVQTVTQHNVYIVATCDADLKRRLRKIPGVPIMYISKKQYTIERLPEVFGAPN
jgi:U3 small nucleolar RNA-associated protein 24